MHVDVHLNTTPMFICIYECICRCQYIYIYIYKYTDIQRYVYIDAYLCKHIYIHTYIYTYIARSLKDLAYAWLNTSNWAGLTADRRA